MDDELLNARTWRVFLQICCLWNKDKITRSGKNPLRDETRTGPTGGYQQGRWGVPHPWARPSLRRGLAGRIGRWAWHGWTLLRDTVAGLARMDAAHALVNARGSLARTIWSRGCRGWRRQRTWHGGRRSCGGPRVQGVSEAGSGRRRSPGFRSLPDQSAGRPADLELHAVAASMAGLEGDARDGRGEAEGDGLHWPAVWVMEDGGEVRH